MFWTFDFRNKKMASWGRPRSIPENDYSNLQPDFSVKVYSGQKMKKEDKVLYMMQGDATLGMGDSIWLMTYLRDVYRILGDRNIKMHICTSNVIAKFYSHFLPSTFIFLDEYIEKSDFDNFDHILPAMYYWRDDSGSDKSWIDNKSILERLYNIVGIEYKGLSDWGEFTPDHIMNPGKDFYKRLNINPEDDYIFFQWHSSGICKNLPPKSNIKILKHLLNKFPNKKIYIIGRLNCLNDLERLSPNIKNLSNKTLAEDVFSLAINSDLIIAPDSAGIHLGEIYKKPTVGIFSVLPPIYVAKKFKFPAFMFGSGKCPFMPCGHIEKLPLNKCPNKNANYCNVLTDINLKVLDKCIDETFENVYNYRRTKSINFYESMDKPISFNK